jgi:hypothetical protein
METKEMETSIFSRAFRPIFVLFVGIDLLLGIAEWLGSGWNIPVKVLIVGNTLLFAATGLSFFLHRKGLVDKNVQVFLRMMYSSVLLKMGVCLAAVLVYIFLAGREVSKAGILGCFALYIIYTFLEVKILMGLSKLQKNA